jgi:hypothetical protein
MTPVPAAAVRLTFAEAVADCALLRVRHVEAAGCGGACQRDLLLVWAASVFERWSEDQIGADDLAAAIFVVRSMA